MIFAGRSGQTVGSILPCWLLRAVRQAVRRSLAYAGSFWGRRGNSAAAEFARPCLHGHGPETLLQRMGRCAMKAISGVTPVAGVTLCGSHQHQAARRVFLVFYFPFLFFFFLRLNTKNRDKF